MRKPFFPLIVLALLPSLAKADGPRDVNRDFHHGHDNGFRGNEHSDRPGNFAPGQLSYGGNGCPAGTMQVVFAPDNLSFTILFDQFVADISSNDKGQSGAMSCEAFLPIVVPANQQMEITRVDYRGFVNVPQGGRGVLQSMFNFQEPGRGNWNERDRINARFSFDGPLQENYEISTGQMNGGHGLPQTEVSPCGGQARLHIRNSVRVMAPQGQQAQLTVDSIDGRSNAVYFVNWKACQSETQPPRCERGDCRPPAPGRNCEGRQPCPSREDQGRH